MFEVQTKPSSLCCGRSMWPLAHTDGDQALVIPLWGVWGRTWLSLKGGTTFQWECTKTNVCISDMVLQSLHYNNACTRTAPHERLFHFHIQCCGLVTVKAPAIQHKHAKQHLQAQQISLMQNVRNRMLLVSVYWCRWSCWIISQERHGSVESCHQSSSLTSGKVWWGLLTSVLLSESKCTKSFSAD